MLAMKTVNIVMRPEYPTMVRWAGAVEPRINVSKHASERKARAKARKRKNRSKR